MAQYEILELYPTNKCQLRCLGCYLNQNNEEWSFDDAQRILDSGIFERVDKEVNILGGEPTTWEYLLDLVQSIRDKNKTVKISITTNAVRLTTDKKYFKNFIDCCVSNKVMVNVSWHSDVIIVPTLQALKKYKILNCLIFVPNTFAELDRLESEYKKLSSFCKCYWRPFISSNNDYPLFNKKITEFLLKQSSKTIQSNKRVVNKKLENNVSLVQRNNEDKNFYKTYECKCGKNGVVFTDGKLYHCLSQALQHEKPISLQNVKEIKWRRCNYDYCCCDTFELRNKKDVDATRGVLAL